MKKYVVDDRNGNLIGIFKKIEDARTYIEKDAAATLKEYEYSDPNMPSPTIMENEWSPFYGRNEYTLFLQDNFNNEIRKFYWSIREISEPEF